MARGSSRGRSKTAAQQAHAADAAQRHSGRGVLPSGGVAWLPLGEPLAALGRAADARSVGQREEAEGEWRGSASGSVGGTMVPAFARNVL